MSDRRSHMLSKSKYTADARQAELPTPAGTRSRDTAGNRTGVRDRLVTRWRARQLERELDARRSRTSLGAQVRPRSSEVLAAADELDALADRLLAPDLVDARGVAQVRLPLRDGTGPLYYCGATEDLRSAASRVLRHLQPRHQP